MVSPTFRSLNRFRDDKTGNLGGPLLVVTTGDRCGDSQMRTGRYGD